MGRRKHRYGDETTIKSEAKIYWTERGAINKYNSLLHQEKCFNPFTKEEVFVREDCRTYPTIKKKVTPYGNRTKDYWSVEWWGKKWASGK